MIVAINFSFREELELIKLLAASAKDCSNELPASVKNWSKLLESVNFVDAPATVAMLSVRQNFQMYFPDFHRH